MSKSIYKGLIEDFKEDALSKDVSRGFKNPMTSIKAHYVIERLNEVLGVDCWESDYELTILEKKGIISKCSLTVEIDGKKITKQGVGAASFIMKTRTGDRDKLLGDVAKSAMTESICKAASHFGVGNKVYKGLVEPPGEKRSKKKGRKKQSIDEFEDL